MHLDVDRLETLDLYDVLSGPPPPELQALVDLAALVCEAPSAAINLITSTEQHQLAAHGFDRSVCARADSMCAAVLGETAPVVVVDASRDARFAENPFVTGAIGSVRFYASAPLVVPSGITVGRLCVVDEEPRELGPQQEAALLTLAERVVDLLELRLRTRQLETSRRELTEAREELRRSDERLAVFADQVSHDLRGPLTAILMNAELLADDPEVAAVEHASRFAAGIVEGARRLDQLIAEVLAAAHRGR
jgi:signal transduction histidine kinase